MQNIKKRKKGLFIFAILNYNFFKKDMENLQFLTQLSIMTN